METGEILARKFDALKLAQGIYGDELGIEQNKYHANLDKDLSTTYPNFDLDRLFEIYKQILSNVDLVL